MKVVLVDQEIPHYRAQILSALKESLKMDLVVYAPENPEWRSFLEPTEDDITYEQKRVTARWFPGKRLLWLNYFSILIKEWKPELIVLRHWVRHPLLIPFMLVCRLMSIPVVVWGQGFSRKRRFRPWQNPQDFLNFLIVKLSDAYVGYSDRVVEELGRYLRAEKLFVGRNTLDLRSLEGVINSLETGGKRCQKEQLNLRKANYLVFVGRLQKRKRVDFLIEAFQELSKDFPDCGLLIIGDGEERAALEARTAGNEDCEIKFLGALDFQKSAPYLFCCDVMVIPGWLGLAVNHGFRFGLPVVACEGNADGTGHPPEIEWLVNDVNGLLSRAKTPSDFAKDIIKVLDDRKRLGENAKRFYEEKLRIEKMIEGFDGAIRHAMKR